MTDGKRGRPQAEGKVIKIRASDAVLDYIAAIQSHANLRTQRAAFSHVLERAAAERRYLPASSQD